MEQVNYQHSSLEEIAARVELLQDAVGVGDTPLATDEDVIEFQDMLQYRLADEASDLMTGIRWPRERTDFLKIADKYHQALGAIVLDLAGRTYAETGDSGATKREAYLYLEHSKREMVALDYEKRLEKSSIERSKQWLAQHHKTRFALPFALSGATTAALFKAGEASSSIIDITPTQGGIWGIMTVMGTLAIRSALRTGPHQVGTAVKKQFNTTVKPYMLEPSAVNGREGHPLAAHELPDLYAERHLEQPFGAAAIYLTKYDIDDEADLAPLVEGLLSITQASLYESYGVESENEKKPWYRQVMGRLALAA